jgi:hypothetical protein
MSMFDDYPRAADPARVGTYPALAFSGGGYVWDAVLEYRVWYRSDRGEVFRAFATYGDALEYSSRTPGAEAPLALVRQDEFIDEPEPGSFAHVKSARVTEWPVEFLRRPRRTATTISDFFSPDAPPNRLDILRGAAE